MESRQPRVVRLYLGRENLEVALSERGGPVGARRRLAGRGPVPENPNERQTRVGLRDRGR